MAILNLVINLYQTDQSELRKAREATLHYAFPLFSIYHSEQAVYLRNAVIMYGYEAKSEDDTHKFRITQQIILKFILHVYLDNHIHLQRNSRFSIGIERVLLYRKNRNNIRITAIFICVEILDLVLGHSVFYCTEITRITSG